MEHFCKNQTECLKGIFAIGIVISHLCARCGLGANIGLGPIYTALGYWGVSIFLFITGFGLMSQYRQRWGGYFDNYFRNRILPIYSLNMLLIVLYTLLNILTEAPVDKIEILQSFFFGGTVVKFGWYLQMCMLFYLFFYAAFKINRNLHLGIFLITILITIYCSVCELFNLGSTWYECSYAFVLGMIVQLCYDQKVNSFSYPKRFTFFCASLMLFAVTFIAGNGSIVALESPLKLIVKMFSAVLFCLSIYFGCSFVTLKGIILGWLGNHYLEIYVLQGVSIILADKYLGRDNATMYFMICFISTIILAFCLKAPIRWFMTLVRK